MNPQVFDGQFKPNPYVPFNPLVSPLYSAYTNTPTTGGLLPFEYVGWRDEMESWHETCYIHAGLNPFPETRISGLEAGEAYAPMDGPEDFDPTGKYEYRADKVLAGGKLVGTSTGRIHSWHYRKMISMGLVEPEFAVEGTEVVVVWGNPDQRQKEIRAKVARWSHMNDERNENVDVMKDVPRRFA